jgi:isopenicillin N synthase-like dioxygenase
MAANFSSIPVLDYALVSDPARKPEFISQLRHALINVGFLYLSNSPVAQRDIDSITEYYIPSLFALPQEVKDRIRMSNSPHFLGYSRLGAELTRGKTDYREQFDIATPHICRWKSGDPDYLRLWGPSQVCCTSQRRRIRIQDAISGPRKVHSLVLKPPWKDTWSRSRLLDISS